MQNFEMKTKNFENCVRCIDKIVQKIRGNVLFQINEMGVKIMSVHKL